MELDLARDPGLEVNAASPAGGAGGDRIQRRVAPNGASPPTRRAAGGAVQLRSSGFASQLFADAVTAGIHGDVQCRAADGAGVDPTEHVQRAAAHGLSGSSSSLPHLGAIQQSFGRHDVSNVQAHVGGRAAEGAAAMGAHGYASGNAVAFGSSPDLHLAAHEAAHVVQQRAGVHLKGGVGEVGDAYERHADAVADLVVQGKSAEPLLDQMAPSGAAPSGGGVQRFAIQMDEVTDGGVPRLLQAMQSPGCTPAIQRTILAQVQAIALGSRTATDFRIGADHFALVILPDSATDLLTTIQQIQHPGAPTGIGGSTHARDPRTDVHTLPDEFTTDVGGLFVALCGGDVGTSTSGSISMDIPIPDPMIPHIDFSVEVAHEEHGFAVSSRLRLGVGVGIPEVAMARVTAGCEVHAHGETAAQAAAAFAASVRSALDLVHPSITNQIFGAGQRRADVRATADGSQGTEAALSVGAEVELHHEGVGTMMGSVGLSDHLVHEGGHTERFAAWDFEAEISLGEGSGIGIAIEAHLPQVPSHPADVTLRAHGSIQHSQQANLAAAALDGLTNLEHYLHQAEHNPHYQTVLANVQNAIATTRTLGPNFAQAFFASVSPVSTGLELEFNVSGESPHWVLRQTQSVSLEPEGGPRIEGEMATSGPEHPIAAAPQVHALPAPPAGMCEASTATECGPDSPH